MTTAIACETIKDEILYVSRKVDCHFPFFWLPSALHKFPDKLRYQLQSEIDQLIDEENILLLFGYCGNAVLGLSSERARLIIPKMDDCISLLLGGNERRRNLGKEGCAYYLTKGWMNSDSGIATEYNRCAMKYGHEKSQMVFKIMLKGYRSLDVINTGVDKLHELIEAARGFADILDLDYKVVEGTLDVLYKALLGQWDEDFVVVEPGEKVTFEHFDFCTHQSGMPDVISI
jgi:hypothetical protein